MNASLSYESIVKRRKREKTKRNLDSSRYAGALGVKRIYEKYQKKLATHGIHINNN